MRAFLLLVALLLAGPAPAAKKSAPAGKGPATLELRIAERQSTPETEELPLAGTRESVHLRKEAVVSTRDVADADAAVNADGKAIVNLTLTNAGAKKLGRATGAHVGGRLGFVVDGKLLLAPEIKQRIDGNKLIVSAENWTEQDAKSLAERLQKKKHKK